MWLDHTCKQLQRRRVVIRDIFKPHLDILKAFNGNALFLWAKTTFPIDKRTFEKTISHNLVRGKFKPQDILRGFNKNILEC